MRYLTPNLLAGAIFLTDRVLKFWFLQHPAFRQDVFVGLLQFRYATNMGIAFGVVLPRLVLIIAITIVLAVVVMALAQAYRQHANAQIFFLTLLLAGAISNVLDRIRFGFVVDYINIPFFTVFNLADCMITLGVLGLLWAHWKTNRLQKRSLDKQA